MKIYTNKTRQPNKISFFTLLFSFLLSVNSTYLQADSEGIKFEFISIEDGLSQNQVNCVYQDSRGFIWFGTQDGLNRFDGYGFKIYRHDPENPESLSDYAVNNIIEDPLNPKILWIGTSEGLNRFDRELETFTHFMNDPADSASLSNNQVRTSFFSRDGSLWIGTDEGLNRYNRDTHGFTRYVYDPEKQNGLPFPVVTGCAEDDSGNIWISGRGLCLFERKTNRIINFPQDSDDETALKGNFLTTLYKARNGVLWAGSYFGIYKISKQAQIKKGGSVSYHVANSDPGNQNSFIYVRSIFEDRAGKLWIGFLTGGFLRFNPFTNQFTEYPINSPDAPDSVAVPVRSILEDNSGILWLGTGGFGAAKHNKVKKPFDIYRQNANDNQLLISNEISTVYEDNRGYWWIGTYSGVSRYDTGSKNYIHYRHEPNNPQSLSHNDVQSILRDRRGNLWIGTFGGGLNMLNERTGRFDRFRYRSNDTTSLSNNYIHSIYEDSKGNLWIGTGGGGLNRFDYEKSAFVRYTRNSAKENWLRSSEINCILEDHSGAIWLGTTLFGIYKFDAAGKKFIEFMHRMDDPSSLSSNRVISIYEDKKHNLWIGTFGGGLNIFDREKASFTHYTTKHGLPGNTIFGILEDDFGNLWLSTDNGISKFNPETETFRNYHTSDGLPSNQFSLAACKCRDGSMLFGTGSGLMHFSPDSIMDNPYTPPVIITDFQIFNKSVPIGSPKINTEIRTFLDKSISESNSIELFYNENVFTFEFSALHYAAPYKNQYRYKMEGFDRDWVNSGNRRFATYTNLDPGEYVFYVKGSNSDGLWNEQGTSVIIKILPPWWRTAQAYVIYLVLFGLMVYGLRRFELNREKMRSQLRMHAFETRKLQEVDHLKSQFFANISHEFRTPLTLILGPLENLLTRIKDKSISAELKLIKRNSERLLTLINQILDLSRLESGKEQLSVVRGDFINVLRGIVMSFASLAEQRDIDIIFESAYGNKDPDIYFDRDKVEKIFTNLLSNAFKFTQDNGMVRIEVNRSAETAHPDNSEIRTEFVVVTITNSGSLIPQHEINHIFDRFYRAEFAGENGFQSTGIGLALVKELTSLHHGVITVSSSEEEGTSFSVFLPIGMSCFAAGEIGDEVFSGAGNVQITTISDSEVQKEADLKQIKYASESDKPIVLVVEDHTDVRKYIVGHLHPDYCCLEASDGEAGFKAAMEQIPDLVISDVMMLNLDGYQLCERLKTDQRTSHIPVILLTARAGEENKIKGLETGADDYLIKPFNVRELQTRVKNLINQRLRLRERFHKEGFLKYTDMPVTSVEQNFLNKLREVLEKHIGDENLGIEILCDKLAMSARQLQRKIRALTGESPTDLIRSARLERARYLLENHSGNVTEIAFSLGFNNLSYFARCFRDRFGIAPSEYTKN